MLTEMCELVSICLIHPILGCTKLTPLGESGGTVGLEILSAGKIAVIVEVAKIEGMEGCKRLHAAQAQHRPIPPLKRLMQVLSPIVPPAAGVLLAANAKFRQRRAIESQHSCHDLFHGAVPRQHFLRNFNRAYLLQLFIKKF